MDFKKVFGTMINTESRLYTYFDVMEPLAENIKQFIKDSHFQYFPF